MCRRFFYLHGNGVYTVPIVKAVWGFLKSFRRIFHKTYLWAKKYHIFYLLLGLLAPKKTYPETENRYRYGVVICARNEEKVIGNLIDSIQAQSYDSRLVQIFVAADNCTDSTAEICRRKGCTVYERNDPEHARKGYAMQFLFEQIGRDYGIESFDGYIVFDADNLLHPDFITELNKAFDTGAGVVVGYRNTKNFDRNFISAGYGIHFMRSVVTYHRPRVWLHTSTHIAGTGFVIASRLLKDGWRYTCLTEDTQFTLNSVAAGEYIAFCEDAEFFDEQPYELRVMARQRIRWIKGRMYSFFSTLPGLFKGIFTNGRRGFACYDMIVYAFPGSTYYAFRQLVFPLLGFLLSGLWALATGAALTKGASSHRPFWLALWLLAEPQLRAYLRKLIRGALVVIRERRHIRCSTPKLILYTLAFPWFDTVGPFLAIAALFTRARWKPIKHDADISIDQLTQPPPCNK